MDIQILKQGFIVLTLQFPINHAGTRLAITPDLNQLNKFLELSIIIFWWQMPITRFQQDKG